MRHLSLIMLCTACSSGPSTSELPTTTTDVGKPIIAVTLLDREVAARTASELIIIDETGNIVQRAPVSSELHGLTWDGRQFASTRSGTEVSLVRYDRDGSIVDEHALFTPYEGHPELGFRATPGEAARYHIGGTMIPPGYGLPFASYLDFDENVTLVSAWYVIGASRVSFALEMYKPKIGAPLVVARTVESHGVEAIEVLQPPESHGVARNFDRIVAGHDDTFLVETLGMPAIGFRDAQTPVPDLHGHILGEWVDDHFRILELVDGHLDVVRLDLDTSTSGRRTLVPTQSVEPAVMAANSQMTAFASGTLVTIAHE